MKEKGIKRKETESILERKNRDIYTVISERVTFLTKLISEKEKALSKCIEGSLRVARHGKNYQYYWRKDQKDPSGKYIRNEDVEIVKRLAQKEYDKKILNLAKKENKLLMAFLNSVDRNWMIGVYHSIHDGKKQYINPVIVDDETFVKEWESYSYNGKAFPEGYPEYYTKKGERVRSKSEIIIANTLYSLGIPYRYECPLLVGENLFYPDFTMLNVRTRKEKYLEHLGMMGDCEYAKNAMRKLTVYERNGFFPGDKLLLTHETADNPLVQSVLENMLKMFLL